MTQEHPTAVDPVCGMTVETERAAAAGLTVEKDGVIYYFCGQVRRPGSYAFDVACPAPDTGRRIDPAASASRACSEDLPGFSRPEHTHRPATS